jgi:hypothetical protein
MLFIEKLRWIAMIFILSSAFILTITIVVFLRSNVFAASYDTSMKIVPAKMQDWSSKSASLVRISNTTNTMTDMMNQIPNDVIIKVKSSQIIPVGKESEIALLVLDKNTGKPMTGAQVIIGIERGTSMSTMDMVGGSMFNAKEKQGGSGIYLLGFTPDSNGYYTMHIHVIPPGKSMDSMMDNHLDIGLISK